ncbi:phosphoserine phosphatase SerB [Caulobacter endophyticus]|uniref:phosphoserine phosphatase SerB n=1 Tax=Caulobacter endophyticus TaxID=2172652 RepID=UPI00240FCF2C|nr:phosphoserine phosphatase SerB [Caulobacter endophyticus]MDG2531907.1 phosphoserine phosphatase SerB [Caulobacter endophyticus]
MHVLTLVGPEAETLAAALSLGQIVPLGPNAVDVTFEGDVAPVREQVIAAIGDKPVDFAIQPVENRRKRLLIADMDSTIINVECLDELADFAGVKAQVSEITERAMRGELAFEGALRERVGMLKGLSTSALQTCFDERVRLNPGAETLVRTMAAHGARCALVSGGFTFFTSRVAQAAGFHLNRANTLIELEEALTGEVGDPILGKEAKLAALNEETAALGLTPADALAVGDGANDLAMIEAAGLGVAYRAKPIVAAQAHAKVDHADLTALLYFQGYRFEEFAQ